MMSILLGGIINIIGTSKKICIEVNAEKTKCFQF